MRTLADVIGRPLMPAMRRPGTVDMSSAVKGIRAAKPSVKRNSRVEQCRHDIKKFMMTYLKHHCTKPFCELHHYIFDTINAPAPETGKRDALIAPRKFSKTTIISLALPLFELAYQRKHFVLMIGESSTTAEANLATLTQELETNELLLEDFPHLAPARDPKNQYVKWTDRQLVFANHATAMAKGMGSRMRGIKYRQRRPDLAILDDPESPETGDTFLKRQRHKRWFGGTFLGLGAEGWDIYVIGNLPNHDCLIADLARDPDWHGRLYRAINIERRPEERYPVGNTKEDGSALWPEMWPLEALDAYKKDPTVGTLGFAREMMNDPREEEDKPFDPPSFEYFDYSPEHHKKFVTTAIGIDPAGGEKPGEYRKGIRDWFCAVAAGRTKDGYIDIFDVEMNRLTPDDQIDTVLTMYDRTRVRQIVAEENMYKNLYATAMAKAARERHLYPNIQTVIQTGQKNKIARILGIQPAIMDFKTIRFARHLLQKVPKFFSQFDEFPQGHDDGPDATEITVRGLERKMPNARPQGIGGSSYWRRT